MGRTIKTQGDFRLQTLTRINYNGSVVDVPESEGIGLEVSAGEDAYVVIGIIHFEEDRAVLESVGDRLFGLKGEDYIEIMELFRYCAEMAEEK